MALQRFLAIATLLALTGLAACGSGDEATGASPATTTSAEEGEGDEPSSTSVAADDDEHGDDEHDDDDEHGDDGDSHDDDHDEDDQSSGLGAHEHGAAEMAVTWIDGDVAIELISPTFNVFGFEYEPETDEDAALAEEQTETLSAPETITINDEASCSLTDPVSTEVEYEGSHAEITASWLFTCAEPDEISLVDATGLFEAFPNFEDIDAQWVSATDQSAGELSPEAPILRFES